VNPDAAAVGEKGWQQAQIHVGVEDRDQINHNSWVLVYATAVEAVDFAGMDLPVNAVYVDVGDNHDTLGGVRAYLAAVKIAGVDLPVTDVAEEASSGKKLKHWHESLGWMVVYESVGDLDADGPATLAGWQRVEMTHGWVVV